MNEGKFFLKDDLIPLRFIASAHTCLPVLHATQKAPHATCHTPPITTPNLPDPILRQVHQAQCVYLHSHY